MLKSLSVIQIHNNIVFSSTISQFSSILLAYQIKKPSDLQIIITMYSSKLKTLGDFLDGTDDFKCRPERETFQHIFTSEVKTQHSSSVNLSNSNVSVKREVKRQPIYPKEEDNDMEAQAQQALTVVRISIPDNQKNIMNQVIVTKRTKPKKRRVEPVAFNNFKPEDIWDNKKILYKAVHDNEFVVPELIQIPPDKHVLQKPQTYVYVDPHKKKMYRPPVPRIFASGFDSFIQRKQKNGKDGKELDLAILHIDEIVEQCYKKKLITHDLSSRYLCLNGTLHIKTFLQLWIAGTIHTFDFRRTNFTLVDHRRLSELLMHLYPKQYTIGSIDAFHLDFKEFLSKLYFLSADDYVMIYLTQDNISQLSWWEEIKVRCQMHQQAQDANQYPSATYFSIKQKLNETLPLIENYHSSKEKAEFMRAKLGKIKLQDSQAELEKILSAKFVKNNNQRMFTPEESAEAIMRLPQANDDDEEQQNGSIENQPNEYSYRQDISGLNSIHQEREDNDSIFEDD